MMEDIASALGVSKPTLYRYFKSKDDVLFECHLLAMHYAELALDKAKSEPTGLQSFLTFARENLRGILGELGTFPVITDVDSLKPAYRAQVIKQRKSISRGVRELVRRGVDDGSLRCTDVELAVLFAFGVFNWVPFWYRPDGPRKPDEIIAVFEDLFARCFGDTMSSGMPRPGDN
jgi:AcrR family transcriptional regulator